MSTLIPEIKLKDFQGLSATEFKRLQCCEVTDEDGDYLFTFICPATDFIRVRSEYNGQLSNSVGGEPLATITHSVSTVSVPAAATLIGEPELYVSNKPYKAKRKAKRKYTRKK